MLDSNLYVTYYVKPQAKGVLYRPEPENSELPIVLEFLKQRQPQGEIIGRYTEFLESRRTVKWPQLEKALEFCRQSEATLLIVELGILANNESFTSTLLRAGLAFHCLDQPFITQTILEALSKHAQVQRKVHGQLIREGLKLTTAKSGNPNAAEVITKVNKPKIDAAIVFAFLLEPIIEEYRRKGYSQRLMVQNLNTEGFTAPEGGQWVLSQLQKVLERVQLNEMAKKLESALSTYHAESLSTEQILAKLNADPQAIPGLKQVLWDQVLLKKVQVRIQQIQEITLINRFVLDILDRLKEYSHRQLSAAEILSELKNTEINPTVKQSLCALSASADLHGDPENHYLEFAFESAAKHLPIYLKIVKDHIEQLGKVLKLESHHHRSIESVGLAEPVMQLIQLFPALSEEAMHLIEVLALETQRSSSIQEDPLTGSMHNPHSIQEKALESMD